MNTMKTQTTYTSPDTGATYEIIATPEHRTAYRVFMDPTTKYEEEYTQYTIYLDGKMVQFCFKEQDIPETVGRYEHPWPDISSPWD